MMTEEKKWKRSYLYDANYIEEIIIKEREKAKDLCFEYNNLKPSDIDNQGL